MVGSLCALQFQIGSEQLQGFIHDVDYFMYNLGYKVLTPIVTTHVTNWPERWDITSKTTIYNDQPRKNIFNW